MQPPLSPRFEGRADNRPELSFCVNVPTVKHILAAPLPKPISALTRVCLRDLRRPSLTLPGPRVQPHSFGVTSPRVDLRSNTNSC